MNTEGYYALMTLYAQKHNEGPMPEYEALAYEAMCRATASLCLMQEKMFQKELQKLNNELDGDTAGHPQQGA